MKIKDINSNEDCLEEIYSEQFFNYIIRYNGSLDLIREIFGDDCCVHRVNGQYAVVYRKTRDTFADIVRPGYPYVPCWYGLMDAPEELVDMSTSGSSTTEENGVYSTENSGVTALRNLPGLMLTGKDTLIGFIDTGIDYQSKEFRKKNGKTRIKYIWDQNYTDTNKKSPDIGHYGFGTLYSEDEINTGTTNIPRDENGHGTYIASVAAGSSLGIATEADIIVVKLKEVKRNLRNFYSLPEGEFVCGEDDIMQAVRFMADVAAQLGKPITICLGVGSNFGAHEGRSILEQYLTRIATYRGVCLVAPVGNEYTADTHFRGGASIENEPILEEIEINVDEDELGFSCEIWSRPQIYLELKIISPTGEIFESANPLRDGYKEGYFLYEGTKVSVANVAIDPTIGAQMIFVRFENAITGIWRFVIQETKNTRAEGYDIWLPIRELTKKKVKFTKPEPLVTICAPGSAEGVITVAAYDVRNRSIYEYSSRGFNRSGMVKPDVAASGEDVIGVFAATGTQDRRMMAGLNGGVGASTQVGASADVGEVLTTTRSGSSAAAAIVAGMGSMILEWAIVKGVAPYITNEQIKQLLIQGAVTTNSLKYPNPSWGWGTVNLLESFSRIRL